MWQAPNRPSNKVSQAFGDGVVRIYRTENTAPPGRMPVEALALKETLRYDEQRLGINRLYLSRQAQAEVVRVLRVPLRKDIRPRDVAETEDGQRYLVDARQSVPDVWPPSMDLSLRAMEQGVAE